MVASFLIRAGGLASAALLDGSEADGTNLFTGAPGFTSGWTANESTVTTAAAVAPDGTTTAAELKENSNTSRHSVDQLTPFGGALAVSAGIWSVYGKQGSRRYLQLSLYTAGAYRLHVFADLQTGTITDSGATGITLNSSSIQAAVNGFWKVTTQFEMAPTSLLENSYYLYALSDVSSGGDAEVSYAGNGSGNIYLWRPKLVAI
jgi:hypothetical protein